jgi:hypothetical protein
VYLLPATGSIAADKIAVPMHPPLLHHTVRVNCILHEIVKMIAGCFFVVPWPTQILLQSFARVSKG